MCGSCIVNLQVDSTMIEAAPIAEAIAQSQGGEKKLNYFFQSDIEHDRL